MLARPERFARHRRWLSIVVAFVATFGQLALAFAPLAEGREGRMASHVEAGGVSSHFVHDEATCVSCQARSMHGPPLRAVVEPIVAARVSSVAGHDGVNVVSTLLSHHAKPRAPPSVI